MKKASWLLPLLLVIASACDQEPEIVSKTDDCLTVTSSSNGSAVPDRYIISLPLEQNQNSGRKKSAKASELLRRHNLDEARILNQFDGKFTNIVLRLTPDEARSMAADGSVVYIEQDKVVSMSACFSVIEPKLVTWNVDKVGYDDGTDKTAWILDTGIDLKHPDLAVDTLRSRSFVPDESSAQDENGHGTHVAGIIGAKNNRIGTLGVASGAAVVGLKVLDRDGNGYLSYVLDALSYVNKNAKSGEVINISLGVDDMSDILDQEVRNVANRGIYVTIAAGNESELASKYSPGRTNAQNIFTVSAVDSLDQFASFSNFGNDVIDYAAPGVRVLSTYIGGRYAVMSGTSMAAPHVSGLLLVNKGKINSVANALNDPDGVPDPIARR